MQPGIAERLAQAGVRGLVQADEKLAIIKLRGAINAARHVPAIARVTNEGENPAIREGQVFADAFANPTGPLVKSGGIASLAVKKSVFRVLELLDGVVALPHQVGFVGMTHVVHDVGALVDGVPDALRAVGAVTLIHGAQEIIIWNMDGHIILVIAAPSEGVVVQIFAEHDRDVIAKCVVVNIVLGFTEDVGKFRLSFGWETSDVHFRQHVHVVRWFAPDIVSVGIPVPIQIAEIDVGGHPVVHSVAHLTVAAAFRHDLVIAAQDHVFQRSG